jgi:prepilin-type N-terminal cleavage/methylation domain-containing protein
MKPKRLLDVAPPPAHYAYRNAFTLIELLVVISILVFLMSILLPVVQRVRNQARAVACQARLHQWSLLFNIQANEKEGEQVTRVFHEIYWADTSNSVGDGRKSDFPILNSSLYLCPMATRLEQNNAKTTASGGISGYGTTFTAGWRRNGQQPVASSYSDNQTLWLMGVTSYDDARKLGFGAFWNEESWRWSNRVNGLARASVPVLFDSKGSLAGGMILGVEKWSPPPVDDYFGWNYYCELSHCSLR